MAPAPPLPVTEDTPPDMLAGSMDLRVVLPGGRAVKMSAERCTPMMDLLVQVTTANKMAPGGFVLQPVGDRGVLPYKPSTPIGALDTWTIQIVPKTRTISTTSLKKAPLKPNNQQPFEQTFRLQVHLPRNQLFVTRVSPKSLLSDVLNLACTEKNLDPNKYELRHPANLEERLRPEWTLADYKLQEVTLVAKGNRPLGSGLSSSDIMALQKEEEKRRQQVRANGGTGSAVLGLMLGKNSQSSGCDGSISSDSLGGRSISPARSDETPSPPGSSLPPPRPTRKRRPAPKPPTQAASHQQPAPAVISHSRNSSDSSGYHEASILSESPESNGLSSPSGTLPRRSKLTSNSAQPPNVATSHNLSRSLSNLTHMSNGENKAGPMTSSIQKNGHSVSTTSLASSGHGKKKKAAPPPPPAMARSSLPGHLLPEQRTASLSTLSSQSSGDSFDRELYSRSATLERPPSSQSSTTSNVVRPESLPEEITAIDEDESISPNNESAQNLSGKLSHQEIKALNPLRESEMPVSLPQPRERKSPDIQQHHRNYPELDDTSESSGHSTPSHVERPVPFEQSQPQIRITKPVVHSSEDSTTFIRETAAPVSEPAVTKPAKCTSNVAAPRPTLPDVVSELQKERDEIQQEFESVTKELQAVILAEEAKQVSSVANLPSPKTESPSLSLVDWEYHLPAPPSAFRDSQSPTLTMETDNVSEVPTFEESTPEVLPPAEFTDSDKFSQQVETSLTSLMIEKECPLIKNLVKGVTKVNPLFNDEKYEAEILEECKRSKENKPSVVNSYEMNNEEDWNPQQIGIPLDNEPKDEKKSTSAYESHQTNQLKNFTISAYQRPNDTDILFKSDSERTKQESEFKKPLETSVYKRKDSNSSTNIPRNNSFSTKNSHQSERAPVKRSTSHVTFNNSGRTLRAKSIGNLAVETSWEGCGSQTTESRMHDGHEGLRKTTSEANINQDYGRSSRLAELQDQFLQWQEQLLRETQPDIPLQSLQVLRRILSPSHDVSRDKTKEKRLSDEPSYNLKKADSSKPKSNENNDASDLSSSSANEVQLRRQSSNASNAAKRYSYQGPPAVNFSTWSERPKSQVSLKVDNDYRIGKGQNSSGPTIPNKLDNVLETKEKKISEDQVDSKANPVVLTRSESMTHVNGHAKVEPTALTMRIISHTTPSGFKKISPATTGFTSKSQDLTQSKEKDAAASHNTITRVHSYNSAQIADPSRVPIVRAVELKKSFLQGQQIVPQPEKKPNTTNIKLSWNEGNNNVKSVPVNGIHNNGKNNKDDDDDDVEETFQGVNNLAKRFSLAASNSEGIKFNATNKRPLSAYLPSDIKPKTDSDMKNESNLKEANCFNNSNAQNNVRKYTSVVGVNGVGSSGNFKEPTQDGNQFVPKVAITTQKNGANVASKSTGAFNARHPMPVVKGFRFATSDYSDSSLVAADSYKVPQNSQQSVTVKVQQNNSFHHPNQRNSIVIESSPVVNVRIQPASASKPSQGPTNGSRQIPEPPSAPALPKKTQISRPKSFPVPEVNSRDELMDAIRSFGGRGKLRQTSAS